VKSLATLGNELYSAKTSIPFVGKRKIWYLIAVVVILGSATLLGTVGLTPGIDFKGGSEITITGLSSPSERPANEVLSKSDLAAGSSVTTMGSSSVRVQTSELSKQRLDSLAGQLATAYKTDASNVSATTVGPTWSSDVTKKAVRGLVLFFIFVGLLIWAYFRTWKMAALANLAVNQTFIRSINTSVVGVLPVASLLFVGAFILGAGTLRDIALTLFIGMIAGTLSSIFLATPLLVDLRSREKRIKEQAAKVAAARQHRREEAGDDVEELAKIDAAPAASPVTPGHHLGVAAQPKRKKKRR